MCSPLRPLVLLPLSPADLLTYVLAHHVYPATILICSDRATFLSSLLNTTTSPESALEASAHHLLIPTLHQLAITPHITTIFVPTLSHLRAWISTSLRRPLDGSPPGEMGNAGERTSKGEAALVVYGLVALHRNTSEWSAQGLGTSVAGVVEWGRREGRGIMLGEDVLEEEQEEMEDEGQEEGAGEDTNCDGEARDDEAHKRGDDDGLDGGQGGLWMERLPILSGSVRRLGGDGMEGIGGRTVEVGRVLGRWCHFEGKDHP